MVIAGWIAGSIRGLTSLLFDNVVQALQVACFSVPMQVKVFERL